MSSEKKFEKPESRNENAARSYTLVDDKPNANDNDLEQPLLNIAQKPASNSNRFESYDLFRGFIMIVMCWDHSKDILVDLKENGSEGWDGELADFNNDFFFFFARVVSDICAPGFFFTMGFSMLLFTQSRLKQNWTYSKIVRHFFERSMILVFIDRVANFLFALGRLSGSLFEKDGFINPFTNTSVSWKDLTFETVVQLSMFSSFQVMTCLGLCMLLISVCFLFPFLRLNEKLTNPQTLQKHSNSRIKSFILLHAVELLCFCLFAFGFCLSNYFIVINQVPNPRFPNNNFPHSQVTVKSFKELLARVFVFPGQLIENSRLSYPVFPWLSFCFIGLLFAFRSLNFAQTKSVESLTTVEKHDLKLFSALSALCGVSFFVVRLFFGKFGNLRGYPRGDGDTRSADETESVSLLIEFFYTCKYPPSFAYALITFAVNFALLALFTHFATFASTNGLQKRAKEVLLVFGRVPLFFYVVHLAVIGATAVFFKVLTLSDFKLEKVGYNFFTFIPIVIALFPLCKRYELFKSKQSAESWWRML